MGAICSSIKDVPRKNLEGRFIFIKLDINRNSFDFLYIVGKGGFGKVWKVFCKKHKKFYALKEMSKIIIIEKKCEKNIIYERDLLVKINHP
jgi:hypothetical protein